MSRSVVLAGTPRCDVCLLPLRWCTCPGLASVECPLLVDILLHHREQWRPSSTGKLVARALPGTRCHVFRKESRPTAEAVARPGRERWILHPRGTPLVDLPRPLPAPEQLQVVLLDGSWSEARDMLDTLGGWGRTVSLPLTGESRYWLRAQQEGNRYSTAEALLGLLRALDLTAAADQLALHFELHVYASIKARGQNATAAAYLASSPLPAAIPELLARLHQRRPNTLSLVPRAERRPAQSGENP